MAPTLTLPKTIQSPTNPSHKVQYTHLNPGAPHTIIWCYGAGGRGLNINLLQPLITTHPSLSILCIDRYTLPADSSVPLADQVSRTGPALLSELTSITLELLDSLDIYTFAVAGHSAGAYQMLSLATACAGTDRLKGVFPVCTSVPAPYSDSALMTRMRTCPEWMFNAAIKIDSFGADTVLERLWLRAIGSQKADRDDAATFVDSRELREAVMAVDEGDEEKRRMAEAQWFDYRVGFGRIQGLSLDLLTGLWMDLNLRPHAKFAWFTCDADVFAGPATVERVKTGMKAGEWVEIINVAGASHADIFMRKEVWEGMYRRLSEDDK